MRRSFQKETSSRLLLFGAWSFVALLPGWTFRQHYFILLAPACGLFIGTGFFFFQRMLTHRSVWKYIPSLLILFLIGENIYSNYNYYFIDPPNKIVDWRYGQNYFCESVIIGEFLAAHTAPQDRIAVVGSEPQIYFYSHRRSASGHIYMYGMMESQPFARTMQEEFISDIERVQPKYLVAVWIPYSWLINASSDPRILDWIMEYTKTNYRPVGIIDLVEVGKARYIWGQEAERYTPISQHTIVMYERIGSKL